jgi:hypothetical protein
MTFMQWQSTVSEVTMWKIVSWTPEVENVTISYVVYSRMKLIWKLLQVENAKWSMRENIDGAAYQNAD